MSNLSGERRLRDSVKMLPAWLKSLSEAAVDDGEERYFRANDDNIGQAVRYFFQYIRELECCGSLGSLR